MINKDCLSVQLSVGCCLLIVAEKVNIVFGADHCYGINLEISYFHVTQIRRMFTKERLVPPNYHQTRGKCINFEAQ
jgi:hypothetical protein